MNIAIGLGLSAACLLGGMVWAAFTAPEGYETDEGFFYGTEPCSDYDEQLSGAGVTPGSPQRPPHRCGRYLGE
jgi:hypothetical protein